MTHKDETNTKLILTVTQNDNKQEVTTEQQGSNNATNDVGGNKNEAVANISMDDAPSGKSSFTVARLSLPYFLYSFEILILRLH